MQAGSSRFAALVAVASLAAAAARAERLPVRWYSAAQGLPGGPVNRIFRDSKGFVWFCTGEGVARFDGYAFTTLGVEDGLPPSAVLDILETRDGSYWLATGTGLCRLAPSGANAADVRRRPAVVRVPGDRATPNRLLEDRSGTLWCGAEGGLFRVDRDGASPSVRPVDLGMPSVLWHDPIVTSLAEDGRGGLWIGAGSGLYHRTGEGRVERFTTAHGLPDNPVQDVSVARDGDLWLATRRGLVHLHLDPVTLRPAAVKTIAHADGLATDDIESLHLAGDGRLWVGTASGVSTVDGESVSNYGPPQGIYGGVFSLEEDGNGDFWLGGDGGVERVTRNGLVTYDVADGIADPVVDTLIQDRAGQVCAIRAGQHAIFVSRLKDNRFESIEVRLPTNSSPGWGWNQSLLQDHLGEWWLPTNRGLIRFGRAPSAASLASARPRHAYTTADGLVVDDVFVVFEDSRGDVWLSMASPVTNGLARWQRETDRIESFQGGEGLPPLRTFLPTVFAEDKAGTLWIAFNRGCVARFQGGRFDLLAESDGVPQGWITALLVDRAGRIWIAAGTGGLGVIDDPGATHPRIRRLGVTDGLSSNSARCLVEDAWDRVYVGTGNGVDCIEDARRIVQHFTEAEGLTSGPLRTALRDKSGAIWFGSKRGLSRYTPMAPSSTRSPSVLITGIRIAGVPHAIPVAGSPALELPDLPFNRNRVQIEFVSPGRRESDAVRYEYRFDDAMEPWIRPGPGRAVDFANLAPGRYRFQVRAVSSSGDQSAEPAVVSFRVRPPFWLTIWFFLLGTAVVAAAGFTFARLRVRRVLALERVRARIASDLHDDIGSNLTRIAILSEVARRKVGEGEAATMLGQIAETSRALVGSMSDAVWSIDPKQDELRNVVARMRTFATDVLDGKGITWTFDAPAEPGARLAPEIRRELFLVFKEAVTNVARHSGARTATLKLELDADRLVLEIGDDGKGFESEPARDLDSSLTRGRGLQNMQVRAKRMGGDLSVTSASEKGVRLALVLPLRRKGA